MSSCFTAAQLVLAAGTGAGVGVALGIGGGVWYAKMRLKSKVQGILDFGDDPDEVLDLSGVVEE